MQSSVNIRGSEFKRRNSREGIKLLLMASPFLILTFLFAYYPLYGWIYAFFDYKPPIPLSATPYVGFHWFTTLVSNPTRVKQILEVLRNTFAISGLSILTSWFPIAFAILLSEIRAARIKKSIQILTTLPNYISWVMVFAMAFCLFSFDGMVNNLLVSLHIISKPMSFMNMSNHTWLAMTGWSLWKGLGWGAIIYLAAIAGIDQELYEAARVDGAGRFRLIWHITVPGLLPTYTVILLLNIASFLNNGFDQYYVFQNAFNESHIQVLDLYVYNIGMGSASYSLATVVGMLKSIVSVSLLFSVNSLSKLLRGETIV